MSRHAIPEGLHVPPKCTHLIYDQPVGGKCVAEIHTDNSVVGKEICRRWNCHEELVATLKQFVTRVEDRIPSLDEWDAAPLSADCAHASAVLAKFTI